MNRFFYLIIGSIVLTVLLMMGCRKDTWDDINSTAIDNPIFDGYHPKFDTIPHRTTGFSGGAGATVIAPTTLQLALMKTAFDWIPYGSPLSLKIGALYDVGHRIDINYSMLFLSDNPDKYMIAVPYIYNNEVSGIIYYYHDATSQGRFLLVEKQEVINQIQQNGSSISGLMPVFSLIAGAFNTIQISKDSTYNATINTWLNNYIENKRGSNNIESRDILTICTTFYSFRLVGGTEYITVWEECFSTTTGGGPIGYPDLPYFGTGGEGGRGGSGEEGGPGDPNSDGPVLGGECWQNLSEQAQEAIVEVMESYYSPCPEEQEAVNQAIQSVMDDICTEIEEKGKVLGTGYEALNLNKSTVTHRVMNKLGEKIDEVLEGEDIIIIDPSTCENVRCITKKLMKHMQSNTNSPFFSFLCNDQNLDYTISSGIVNQGHADASIKGITLNSSIFCNSTADPIQVAETILHESIHTAFYAIDYFQKNNIPTDPKVLHYYNILNGPLPNGFAGNHHEFMAWHVNETATVLWEMNNKVGDIADYYGLIWEGLTQGAGFDPITQNLFNLYIEQVMNVPGNNPNNYAQNQWIQSHYNIYINHIKPNNQLKFDCK